MKKHLLLAGVLAVLSLSATAAQRAPATDMTANSEAGFLAAGGNAWTKIAPGVYTQESPNGEIVRRAFGEAGRTHDLARLHETALELEASLRSLRDPAERAELADAIVRLQDDIRTLEAQQVSIKAKTKTTAGPQLSGAFHDSKADDVCGYYVELASDMSHTAYPTYDYATAQTTANYTIDQFGPPPSLRIVIGGNAKVTNAGRSYLKSFQKSVIPPYYTGSATSGLAQTNPSNPALGCTM
jgi:hypothetical protein